MAETDGTSQGNKGLPSLPDGDDWLSVVDVASMFGRKEETIRRWIRKGQLPATPTPGGRAFAVKRSDADALRERGPREGGRPPVITREEESLPLPGERVTVLDD